MDVSATSVVYSLGIRRPTFNNGAGPKIRFLTQIPTSDNLSSRWWSALVFAGGKIDVSVMAERILSQRMRRVLASVRHPSVFRESTLHTKGGTAMLKRIVVGGIVFSVVLVTGLCQAQEAKRNPFQQIFAPFARPPQAARPSKDQDARIEQLRAHLRKQMRDAAQALQMLETLRHERQNEKVERAAEQPTRKGEEGFRALYTIARDGTKAEYLTSAPGMISSSSPAYSHDGTMVAFDATADVGALGDCRLFVVALEGPFKGMFKDFGCGNVPTWSPDDSRIAYMLNPGNPADVEWGIWIMNADGSQRKRLCDGWYPRFSPDGKLLHVYAPTSSAIHVIEPGGTKERKIVGETISAKYGGGTWSPDGNRIVFVGTRDGKEHLATVAVDDDAEKSVRILYTEKDNDRVLVGPPAWSPDGKKIVLAIQDRTESKRSGGRWHNTYLYTISAEVPDKPSLLQPAKTGVINRSPMWSPDGKTIIFSSER